MTATRTLAALLLLVAPYAAAEIPRTSSGKPDLSGVYDTGTLTPMQRPEWLGSTETLYPFVARFLNWGIGVASGFAVAGFSEGDREAPPEGGEGPNGGGAGRVGGYNFFWIDPGEELGTIDGTVPTSMIYDPPNGRIPETVGDRETDLQSIYASFMYENTGTATWLATAGPGAVRRAGEPGTVRALPDLVRRDGADDPEPVQQLQAHRADRLTRDDPAGDGARRPHHPHRLGARSGGATASGWATPSAAGKATRWWSRPRHFRPVSGLPGADENLHVVERFTPLRRRRPLLRLHRDRRDGLGAPWSGRYVWQAKPDSKVYEYACHEGNYAMGNILRGARLLESEWQGKRAAVTPAAETGGAGG